MLIAAFALLAVAFAVQAGAWLWVHVGLERVRADAEAARELPPTLDGPERLISVVVAAHDEAARLPGLLDALAAQATAGGGPRFEVVVVDDRSTDGTGALAEARAAAFPVPLRIVRIVPGDAPQTVYVPPSPWSDEAELPLPPKKNALAHGIAAAAHERLAFTDADCRPPPTWLATLARHAADGRLTGSPLPSAAPGDAAPGDAAPGDADAWPTGHAVLVGYGPTAEAPGWLNRFCRYETVLTAALSAGAAGHGRPWHAVGRNLSYTRALWERIGRFDRHAGSLSGDDDLLVQDAAGVAPVRYVLDPDAFVPSPAPRSWRAFWRQKRRHSAGGAFYRPGVLRALGALQASGLALWLGAPLLHALGGVPWGWGLLGARMLVQRAVLQRAWDALGAEADLRLWHPVLDAAYALYQAAAAVLGLLPVPRDW